MVRVVILRILESYFRHRWLHLLPIVLLGIAAAAYTYTLKPTYATTAVLYVEGQSLLAALNTGRQDGFSWYTPAQVTAEEVGELMQSDAFVRAIIHRTVLEELMDDGPEVVKETIEEARWAIFINRQGKNQVTVSAVHEIPQVAQELVGAVVETYIQWKINSDLEQSSTAQVFYDDVIVTYGADLEKARDVLRAYLEAYPAPIRGERPETEQLEIEKLRAAVKLAEDRHAKALEKRETVQLARSQTESDTRQTYYVLDAARFPTDPQMSRRQMAMNALIFLLGGVLVSLMSVGGSALLDRSIRFPLDAKFGLGLPVLGVVPAPARKRGRKPTVQPDAALTNAVNPEPISLPAQPGRLGADQPMEQARR